MTRAFTLIEILIALMLTGLVSALALAPVVQTVSSITRIQDDWGDEAALARTADFIARDIEQAMRLASNVITINDDEALGGWDDDTLLVMSSAPTAQGFPAGTVVYRIEDGGVMSEVIPGLYRWIVPGKVPNEVNVSHLEAEDGQLVLPDVCSFNVEVPAGEDDNKEEYTGALPEGIYLKIGRGKRNSLSLTKEEEKAYECYIVIP